MQEAERANERAAERSNPANVQPFQGPAVPGQPDRPAQVQHNPNAPSFNANARPMQQAVPPPAVEGQGVVATQPRFQPRMQPIERGERGSERFNGRGAEAEARIAPPPPQFQRPQQVLPVVEAPAQHLGRPEREMRNIQQRPQPVERPQQIAPVAPAAPIAPVVAVPPPQRIEVPRPPQAEPRAHERGPGREGPGREIQGREGPGREGPNRVVQER